MPRVNPDQPNRPEPVYPTPGRPGYKNKRTNVTTPGGEKVTFIQPVPMTAAEKLAIQKRDKSLSNMKKSVEQHQQNYHNIIGNLFGYPRHGGKK